MMPRWDGGYGFQILFEDINREELMNGDRVVDSNKFESVELIHFQGVYTWDKSIRFTFKIPYVLAAERINLDNERQIDSGLGDIKLALPLKRYFNLDRKSGSWTFSPQIILPTSKEDAYNFYNSELGLGLFGGYEIETYRWFFSTGIGYWVFDREEPDYIHINSDLGINLREDIQILIENDYHYDNDGLEKLSVGPALYFRQNLNTHYRIEYKKDLISKAAKNINDHVNETKLSFGVGFVF